MSDYQGKKFKEFIIKLQASPEKYGLSGYKTAEEIAKMLGVTYMQLSRYYKSRELSRKTVEKILSTFKTTEEEVFGIHSVEDTTNRNNAHFLGIWNDEGGETPFLEISPGKYLLLMPLVDESAYAGYPGGYKDPEFIEELPKHSIIVDKVHRGKFLAFDIVGDSMDDGTKESIPDKSIAAAREVPRQDWKYKLHNRRHKFFIIVHKTEGIVAKEIVKHDTEKGIITCHSLNQNKDLYPDYDLYLDDVLQIFSMIKVSKEL